MRNLILIWGLFSASAYAVDEPKVHYRQGKEVNFEELLIQGQIQRPEVSVVTGNVSQGGDGLLRLRENFIDRLAEDMGENVSEDLK